MKPNWFKQVAGWLVERAGRLKLNTRVFSRSPLSSVLELEALMAGVDAKRSMWQALRLSTQLSADKGSAASCFGALVERAEGQHRRLEALHAMAVRQALGPATSQTAAKVPAPVPAGCRR